MMEKEEKGGKSSFSLGEKESANKEETAEQRAARLSRQRERDRAHHRQLIVSETPEQREAYLE